MSGNKLDLDWNLVTTKAKEITDNVHSINRVAYILNKDKIEGNINCFDMNICDEAVDLTS